MPTCKSCGNTVPTLTQDGYCPACSRIIMRMRTEQESRAAAPAAPISPAHQEMEIRRSETERTLAAQGVEGYYEYKVLSVQDGIDGTTDPETLSVRINALSIQGWRVVAAISNEIGRNRLGPANSAIAQNMIIMERYKSLK